MLSSGFAEYVIASSPTSLTLLAADPKGAWTLSRGRWQDGPRAVLALVERSAIPPAGRLLDQLAMLPRARVCEVLAEDRTSEGRVLLLADPGGPSLASLRRARVEPRRVLEIAESIAVALAGLHATGRVHGRLELESFVLDADDRPVLAELLALAQPPAAPGQWDWGVPELAQGTLDARSDLYLVGVLMHELLYGRPPMPGLARGVPIGAPTPPAPLPAVPDGLAAILSRLLAPDPADRYPDAEVLIADLGHAAAVLAESGTIPAFPTGRRGGAVRIREASVAREVERGVLTDALAATAAGASLRVEVVGAAGTGKTMLLEALRAPTVARGGCFGRGRGDPLGAPRPLGALAGALDEIAVQILTGDHGRLEQVRRVLTRELGPNASLITTLSQRLKWLVGHNVDPLLEEAEHRDEGITAAAARLEDAVERLLFALASAAPPLVLAVDDLHRADPGTLAMLKRLERASAVDGLLVLVAWRPEEASPQLAAAFHEGEESRRVNVAGLDVPALTELVRAALGDGRLATHALARLAYRRTSGNPMLVQSWLRQLAASGAVVQDDAGGFSVDFTLAAMVDAGADVTAVVGRQIASLGAPVREVLAAGARVGAAFEAGLLAELLDTPRDEIDARLAEAARADVVARTPLQEDTWRFLHERLHRAALDLLDRAAGITMHVRIGERMCARLGPEPDAELLLRAVHQRNLGAETLSTVAARDDLAGWNLRATRAARASGAFVAALGFVDTALRLLGPDAWARAADTTTALYLEGARAAILAAPPRVDAFLEPLVEHAADPLLAAEALELRVDNHLARYDAPAAFRATRAALSRLGYDVPERVGKLSVALAVARAYLALRGRSAEQLVALPEVKDPREAAVLRVLLRGSTAAYLSDPDLFAYVACEMVRYGLRAGACPGTAWGLMVFAVLQSGAFGDLEGAYLRGDIARRMLQRFAPHGFGAKFASVWLVTQVPTHHPLRVTLEPLRDWLRLGLADGDPLHAAINAAFYLNHLVFSGEHLERVAAECRRFEDEMRVREQGVSVETAEPFGKLARRLRGLDDPFVFLDLAATQPEAPVGATDKPFHTFSVHFCACVLAVLAGRDADALVHAGRADLTHAAVLGTVNDPLFLFFAAVAAGRLLVMGRAHDRATRRRLSRGLAAMRRRAKPNPVDYAGRVAFLEGLAACAAGRFAEGLPAFDRAWRAALDRGAPHEAALALETSAVVHAHLGARETARLVRAAAVEGWRAWGAIPLVEAAQAAIGPTPSAPALPPPAPEGVDVMLRATQALAGDVSRDALLASLVRLAALQAHAERVILLVGPADNLGVRAVFEEGGSALVPGLPLAQYGRACLTAARLAAVTGEVVLEPEANRPGAFGLDAWVRAAGVRSVLALPISLRGTLRGVLLLEDTRAGTVFSSTDVTVLRVLATVAAALLENAELLAALEDRAAELRQANAALQEQSRLLEQAVHARTLELDTLTQLQASMLDALSEGVCGLDGAGRVTFANPAAARLLGTPVELLVGGAFHDRFHLTDHLVRVADCPLCGSGDALQDVPSRLRSADGGVRWVECSLQPSTDPLGSGTRVLSFRDVSRRRELEAQVRHSQKMEAIGLFVGGVAHEFNNLLTPILGRVELAQLLLPPDHKVQESLAGVSRAGRRAAELVQQLLTLGRRREVASQPTDLSAAVLEALRFLSPSLDRRITVTYVAPPTPPWALADPGQVHQILLNLCLNARDALLSAPRPGVAPRIDIRIRRLVLDEEGARAAQPSAKPGRWVELEVEDNGPGIPPEIMARIFEPFYTTKATGSGSGLGLAVIHGIVEQHGGWVSVDSQVGAGARFRTTFPEVEASGVTAREAPGIPAAPSARRVLVVDDEPMVRELVRDILEREQFQVSEAPNGREALVRVQEGPAPDLVILDLVMPEMDGWQTLRHLRQIAPDVCVILLSGFDPSQQLDSGDERMAKPFQRAELLATVNRVLERRAAPARPSFQANA